MNQDRKDLFACVAIGVFAGCCWIVHTINGIRTGFDMYLFSAGFLGFVYGPVSVKKFMIEQKEKNKSGGFF